MAGIFLYEYEKAAPSEVDEAAYIICYYSA